MALFATKQRFAELLDQGTPPIGTFVVSSDPATTVIACDAGIEFVVVDREHGAVDMAATQGHLLAASAAGAIGMIRVLENRPALIQQAFDLGAGGVIVPKIGSAEEARRAVAAGRYQPGGRGMSPGVLPARWARTTWPEHVTASNAELLIIPLIETAAGVENAAEIAAVDGVDYLFFGPGDLAQDLALDGPDRGKRLVAIWDEFIEKVHRAGKRAGAPLGNPFRNAHFYVQGIDLMHLRDRYDTLVREYRDG